MTILDEGILLFTIDREEKRNAISYEVLDGLTRLLEAAHDEKVKIVALTGSGTKAFCSGGDLSEFHSLKTKEQAHPMLSRAAEILYSLATLPKPTIAILNGPAVGGGCEIAAACDFRIARSGTKAGFVQGRQGIITGWGGASLLSEKLPASCSMKLLMEAGLHPVEELNRIGFVDSVFNGPPIDALRKFASEMLVKESGVLKGFKQVWVDKWESAGLKKRIENEVRFCAELWETEAHHQHVAKFLRKKK
ncbi:enoyl-CoA hydratase [Bacillus sp. FJAT-27225]|nr:enoyl-CoA hydratase [Bacillus sp. FJAT-27225]